MFFDELLFKVDRSSFGFSQRKRRPLKGSNWVSQLDIPFATCRSRMPPRRGKGTMPVNPASHVPSVLHRAQTEWTLHRLADKSPITCQSFVVLSTYEPGVK